MKIAATVSYDGTNYAGWQLQKNKISVQECIENALFQLFNERVKIVGSGRTDSGVHALRQVFHFTAKSAIPPEKIAPCLNNLLPKDIRILKSVSVDKSFHARYDVLQKTYEYNMYISDTVLPLKDRYSVRVDFADIDKMKDAAKILCKTCDFAAFSSTGSNVIDTVRTIYSLEVEKKDCDIKITVCGSGFLYNMVRIIAGTLLDIGQGRLQKQAISRALNEKNRKLLGKTMAARGLVLKDTQYANIYKIY